MPSGGRPPRRGWETRFFNALRQTALLSESCKVAGISKSFFYQERKRNPEFALRYEEELERQTEILEQIAVKRAADGSDTLMIFILKARRPEVYRENVHHQHDHQVAGTVNVEFLGGHDPIEFEAAKRRAAAKELLSGEEEVIEGTVVGEEVAAA